MTAAVSAAALLALLGGGEPSLAVSFSSRLIGMGAAAARGCGVWDDNVVACGSAADSFREAAVDPSLPKFRCGRRER